MKKFLKKGFTIVELVIVIAVIAILTAVLIPTISSVVHKAQVSADTQLVRNLNTALKEDEALNGKPVTMQGALDVAAADGYDLAKINAKARDNEILWDSVNNVFAYLKGSTIEYTPDVLNKKSAKDYDYWVISDEVSDKYSTYYVGTTKEFTGVNAITKGFDAGTSKVTKILYKNSGTKQDVVIRTNSAYTTLTIDAEKDTVKHYGNANIVNITSVAPSSYYENGSVSAINVKDGRVEIKENAFVGTIAIDNTNVAKINIDNSGTVFATKVVEYSVVENDEVTISETTASEVASEKLNNITTSSSDDVLKIGNADALINLASIQSQGVINNLKIELTANIDLTNKTWIPFGADLSANEKYAFNGAIDGKNYSIIGLSNGSYVGPQIANGTTGQIGEHYGFIDNSGNVTISNLTFKSVDIDSDTATVCSAVVAYVAESSNVTLTNVKVEGNITGTDKVGGLVGYAKDNSVVTVSNCTVNANLTAHEYRIGGFFGFIAGGASETGTVVTISDSSFAGKIIAENTTNKTTYIGAIGSIHAAKNNKTTVTVSNFTVGDNSQVQSLTATKKIANGNGVVLLGIMSGTATSTGVENSVAAGDFTITLA